MFADDIVRCSKSKEAVQTSLEKWRHALEKRKIKVTKSKAKYIAVNKKSDGQLNLRGVGIEKVKELKYFGSTV